MSIEELQNSPLHGLSDEKVLTELVEHYGWAVLDAAINRFRPIFLTTVTTCVGLLPIMAERSTTAEFLKPAVLSLSFGVLFALFVSLLMVPALYMVGWDYQQLMRRLRGKAPAGTDVSEPRALVASETASQ